MGSQVEHGVPYRLSIYWKVENEKAGPSVLVYAFGGLIRLNQTASLIWEMVDGRHSEEEMFAALRRHFPEAAAERLRDDLESFLQSAQASGLILRHWSPLQPYEILYEELVP